MTEVADSEGGVHDQVPVDGGGGAVQVPEREDVPKVDDDDAVQVRVDDEDEEIDVQDQVQVAEGIALAKGVNNNDVTRDDE